jgi:hypothetical protein
MAPVIGSGMKVSALPDDSEELLVNHCLCTCRRAYEKHFKEFRHQAGMRALGIPNNKNFFEVSADLPVCINV